MESDILKVQESDISKIVNWKPASNTYVFDNQNKIIATQYSKDQEYVKYKNIPKVLINAIISTEDKNFFNHNGVDLVGMIRAALSIITHAGYEYRQGASTITQQVVRSLLLTKDKTISRKLREINLALFLESKFSKEKIMEIYCNTMFLGNGSYGVSVAAKRYFGKTLAQINIAEAALIAGLFQLPSYYNPKKHSSRAKKRQETVLKRMKKNHYITLIEYEKSQKFKLEYEEYLSLHGKIAPYFVDYSIKKTKQILKNISYKIKDSGLKIYTTLDSKVQLLAENAIKKSNMIFNFAQKNMINVDRDKQASQVEAALISVDHRSGEIIALVGGRDYSFNQYNRATSALRAPGSLFKSIIYSYALKKGRKWNDLFYIAPLTIGNYRPHTSTHNLLTETTMLTAFSKSINSVAVDLGIGLGINNILKHAKKLGVDSSLKKEASTLLGGSEVSMLDMAQVYSTLANKGSRVDHIIIKKIVNDKNEIIYQSKPLKKRTKKVLSTINSELINEGLKEVVSTGTAYRIRSLHGRVAGKTGTSNKSKDNWFAGSSQNITTIAWVGSDHQVAFNYKVSASTVAVPFWGKYMKPLMKLRGEKRLYKPNTLKKIKIDPKFGMIDKYGKYMYFSPYFLPKKHVNLDLKYISNGKKLRIGFE